MSDDSILVRLLQEFSELKASVIRMETRLNEIVQPAKAEAGATAQVAPAPKLQAVQVMAREPDPAVSASEAPATIRLMIAGARSHGRKHIDAFLQLEGCQIDYICDVDTAVGEAAVADIERRTGTRPRFVRDIRDALGDPQLQAVSIATPHHWHALMAIWSLQANKHVYIEKPLAHDFREGESVVAAARKYGKVVQFGTQLRSNASLRTAAGYIRDGRLGEVEVIHCLVYKPRSPVPPTNEDKIPSSVDYDQWCGPAPLAPVTRSKFHYHWHWFWDFGNGALGNNGIHRVDVARIGMGKLLPGVGDRVLSFGGSFGGADSRETPNVQVAVHRFGRRWIVQEVFGLPVKPWLGVSNGIIFHGETGKIIYKAGGAFLTDDNGEVVERFEGKQNNHFRNFVAAIRENNPRKVKGIVEEGHLSSALCHLANISYRLGAPASDDEIASRLEGLGAPALVRATLDRVRANLLKANETGALTLGETLALDIDAKDGPIIDDERASAMLGRPGREGYRIPSPSEV